MTSYGLQLQLQLPGSPSLMYTLVYMCMPRARGCARDFNRICALTVLEFLDWLMAFVQVGVPCSAVEHFGCDMVCLLHLPKFEL